MTQRIVGNFVPDAIPSSTTNVFRMFAGTSGHETRFAVSENSWENRYVEVLYQRRDMDHAYAAVTLPFY
jgi:hypothetical protein